MKWIFKNERRATGPKGRLEPGTVAGELAPARHVSTIECSPVNPTQFGWQNTMLKKHHAAALVIVDTSLKFLHEFSSCTLLNQLLGAGTCC